MFSPPGSGLDSVDFTKRLQSTPNREDLVNEWSLPCFDGAISELHLAHDAAISLMLGNTLATTTTMPLKPQSHQAYDQVTTYLRPKNVAIDGKS